MDPATRESLPLKHVRTLLAKCPAFRTLVGAADEAEALESVLYHTRNLSQNPRPYPFAIVAKAESGAAARSEATNSLTYEGEVLIDFLVATDPRDTGEAQLVGLDETLGGIMEEFVTQAQAYGLNMTGIREDGPAMLAREQDAEELGVYGYKRYAVGYVD